MAILGKNAYAVTNKLTGLAAGAFTPAVGNLDATRSRLNDAKLRSVYAFGSNTWNAIGIDFGAAVNLIGWGILNHNLVNAPAAASVSIRAADDAGMSVNPVAVKAATTLRTDRLNYQDHVLQHTAVSRRYWQLDFAWGGAVAFVLEVGELFAVASGDLTSLSRKSSYGAEDGGEVLFLPNVFQYGERSDAYVAGPIRQKRYRYSDLSASDVDEAYAMWLATGGPVRPILWVESTEDGTSAAAAAEQECMFAKVLRPAHFVTQDDFGVYQTPELIIRSLGRQIGK